MAGGEMWTQLGSSLAGLMFVWAMFKQYCPYEMEGHLKKYTQKLVSLVYPYIEVTFHEFTSEGFYERSKAYGAIQRYLTTNSTTRAKRLKADMVRDSKSLVLSMDDREEIADEFKGIKVWWASNKNIPRTQVISFYGDEEKRYYKLKFHWRDREIVFGSYLNHVMDEGKAIEVKSRKRKLYTNNRNEQWAGRYQRTMWSKLRKLLIDTSNKSIIVIEDIDCSLDLTGQRKKKEEKDEEGDGKDPVSERIIVFTTNYVEKLDPALIRRGRMDKHIELSYCCFEAFKVLARNYLDLESHDLFETIGKLLEETNISPADVAENLMPKSDDEDAVDTCLANLIKAIEKAKEEAKVKVEEEEKEKEKERAKAEEEKKAKAEKEEKEKAEKEEKDKEKEQKSDEEVKEKKTAGEEVKENGG
ncbi:hypothetical protein C3L33_18895, partial [Rhododendron williamsianum]